MGWFSNSAVKRPTLTSIKFDTTLWIEQRRDGSGQAKFWDTPDHDLVSQYYFDLVPDLPKASDIDDLADFYQSTLNAISGNILQVGLTNLAGYSAILLIFKAPQNLSGHLYQGVITLPFKDCSFVIKILTQEAGTTGVREAILLDQRLKAGETPNLDGNGPMFPDLNPDSPEHDAQFPQHPLSRLRALLRHVVTTASAESLVSNLKIFPLPSR